jgi:dTDP-6-deoxy-L-talose 4-dehydrogenase (NAD+)
MKVLVTGATGFIGRHLIPILKNQGHDILLTARQGPDKDDPLARLGVQFIPFDMLNPGGVVPEAFTRVDAVVHLAWPGLPNYRGLFHIENNLPASYRLIKHLIAGGVSRVLVAGTCFEYGMRNGELSEDMLAQPDNPYAIAKDMLRKQLEQLISERHFSFKWVRLFYMHGKGQNPSSLLAQLDAAIDRGDPAFDMSGGEQIRDYLPVGEVARRLARILDSDLVGIFNCCSGQPISVRRLVETRIAQRGATISLNLGRYPYSPLEPFAFWGSVDKTRRLFDSLP